ncbi:MAG: SRPBCC family protein [Jatrophihabitantaceae bacterium]
MARIRTELTIDASPEAVWALVTDWPAQSRWIPLTAVTIDQHSPAGSGLGTRFTGRTRLGPIRFDDPMEVTQWQPATAGASGHCQVRKLGPWLTGQAAIDVRPAGVGTRVAWSEDVRLRWMPAFADRVLGPVIAAVGAALFGRTLRKMAAELARSRPE